ncbi:MAG: hypothetical protein QF441_16690 [Bacteriovoracaceae bacterium]|nr:hypothetical protein [Bacteriovoracaceae bacterium]
MIKRGLSRYFSSLQQSDHLSGNAYMFVNDFGKSIAPIGGKRLNQKNFSYNIIGNNKDKGIDLLKSLARHKNGRTDTELCCDVINHLASTLFYFGDYHYLYTKIDDEYKLVSLEQRGLFKVLNFFVQLVPKAERNKFKSVALFDTSKNIIRFRVSDNKIQTMVYKFMLKLLAKTSDVTPKFFLENPMNNDANFNVANYTRIKSIFISILTYKYSWPQRSLDTEHITEYYLVHRHMKYCAKKAQIRVFILEQLNSMFTKLEVDAKIVEQGLPVESEIIQSLGEMQRGEISINTFTDWS